jgi:hypothetical protein
MSKKLWHLDSPFKDDFFSHFWPQESQQSLLNLFKYLDNSEKVVLATLPEGIGPAEAAVTASLYFLPGMNPPPKPHCKIALFPGFHFVPGIKKMSFDSTSFFNLTQIARSMQRGTYVLPPTIDKLRRVYKDVEKVNFHWLFKCDRIWTRYGTSFPNELAPRSRFGRGDSYEATIEILDCEDPGRISKTRGPYDLLVYCPYFHSHAWKDGNQLASDLVEKIEDIKADRKLLLVRSPYEFWAREIERRTKIQGVSFYNVKSNLAAKPDLAIKLVDQFINISEAYILYNALEKHLRSGEERELSSDIKSILRFILVSIDPRRNEGEFKEKIFQLNSIKDRLGEKFPIEAALVFESIASRAMDLGQKTKKDFLLGTNTQDAEVWVTKDRDRKSLEELGHKLNVQLMDRWVPAGKRVQNKVILTRIDREGDLDLVSYLKSGDTLLLSSWELVIKAKSIEKAWERSQAWRDRANLQTKAQPSPFDPILELADYVVAAYSNAAAMNSPSPLESTSQTWWDEDELNPYTESKLNRSDILAPGAETRGAIEIELKGRLGVFLPEKSEVQIFKSNGDNEFASINVEEIESGDMLVLFRDAERSSIFDLVMDQLERSSTYGSDATNVRAWKKSLLNAFMASGLSFSDLQNQLTAEGFSFNIVTIRSWIAGPTMAPLRLEPMRALALRLKMANIDIENVYDSVIKVRNLSRVLGRAINELITTRDAESLSQEFRKVVEDAEIDLVDLTTAIDVREVIRVLPDAKQVPYLSLKKIFSY